MEKVRIGLVGTGFISIWHYKAFLKNTDAEIIGICSHAKTAMLDKLSNDWNIKAYECFEEMVNDPKIDAIVIGSRNPDHFPQAMIAIQMGKHVLIEKPIATDLEEINELEGASIDKNVVVFPAHNFVYRKSIQDAKKIITEGVIGKIMYSSFMSTHTIPENHATGWRAKMSLSGGGALMNSGHHLVYMNLFLRGMPSKLLAFKSNLLLNTMECEDIAQVNLLYPDNSIGNIMQSWTSSFGSGINGVKLFGDKGSLSITDALYWNSEKLSTDVEYGDSFVNQSKAFTACILKGHKPASTLDDARNILRIIHGAYESSNHNLVKIF